MATIGIFLPSFLFVALVNPLVKKMRNSMPFSTFLDAVNVASVALLIATYFQMSYAVIVDWRTILIALISFTVAFNYKKINSTILVLGGSLMGYLLTFIG